MRDMAYRWMDRAHEDGDPMLHERALGLKAKADQIDEQYKDILWYREKKRQESTDAMSTQ